MTDPRAKRIAVLTAAAQAKSEAKTRAAEQGIRALVKRGEPITFLPIRPPRPPQSDRAPTRPNPPRPGAVRDNI